jgi:hypothetical protein
VGGGCIRALGGFHFFAEHLSSQCLRRMHSLLLAALFLPVWLSPHVGLRDGEMIETLWARFAVGSPMDFRACVQTPETIIESRLILEYGASRSIYSPQQERFSDGYFLTVGEENASPKPFPFMEVRYWWEVDFPSGTTILSPAQTFQYLDERFSWNRLAKNNILLYWIAGDLQAAEDTLDLALISLASISAELEAPIPDTVTLVIYPKLADFYSALGDRVHGWEGGISAPDAGIILLAAAPGAEGRSTLAALIPHEMTHVLLGEKWRSAYSALPLWLVEGTAAGNEMEPRPEADRALREAVDAGSTIPIRALCAVFPAEEQAALLAYAESKSFVAYISETYGLSAIRNAFAAYAGGADCSRGMEDSTGNGLEKLESDWMNTLDGKTSWLPASWGIVLAGVFMLGGVSAVRWIIGRRKAAVPGGKGRET